MTKAELKAAQDAYDRVMSVALEAEQKGNFAKVLSCCQEAWQYVDGMMRYARRYEDATFKSVSCVDLALKYGPVLLDHAILDALEDLLKAQRSVERNTSDNLGERLADARHSIKTAHKLWNYLENNPGAAQEELTLHLQGQFSEWAEKLSIWERTGLITRSNDGQRTRVRISTDMEEPTRGKCPECGSLVRAAKAAFLTERTCPVCSKTTVIVILATAQ